MPPYAGPDLPFILITIFVLVFGALALNTVRAQVLDSEPPSAPTSSYPTGTLEFPDPPWSYAVQKTAHLFWNPSTDNIGVTGYNVYRDGAFLAKTQDTFYNDYTPPLGRLKYEIEAIDAAGNISPRLVQPVALNETQSNALSSSDAVLSGYIIDSSGKPFVGQFRFVINQGPNEKDTGRPHWIYASYSRYTEGFPKAGTYTVKFLTWGNEYEPIEKQVTLIQGYSVNQNFYLTAATKGKKQ